MATWSVHEAYMNLWVKDTPMVYKPSQGPEMKFQLMYKQRTWGAVGWRTRDREQFVALQLVELC